MTAAISSWAKHPEAMCDLERGSLAMHSFASRAWAGCWLSALILTPLRSVQPPQLSMVIPIKMPQREQMRKKQRGTDCGSGLAKGRGAWH